MFKPNKRLEKKQKVKEWLQSIIYFRQEVAIKKAILDELLEVEKAAEEMGKNWRQVELAKQLNELRDTLLKDVTALLELKNKVKKAIDTFEDPRLRIIFHEKYFKNQTWEDIADKMFFSVIHIKRLAENGYFILTNSIFMESV